MPEKEEQVLKFAKDLKKRGIKRVCIEAGHIYIDEVPNGEHSLSLKIGGQFAKVINEVMPEASVVKMLFIDDYNPVENILNLEQYLETAKSFSFTPDVIIKEASLVGNARNLIEKLSAEDQTILTSDGHTHTRNQNIRLRYASDKLSCCSLDAALYIKKFQEYGFSLTVLPDGTKCEYRKQQRNVRRILHLYGIENLPLANVFFRQDGGFEVSNL